MIKDDEDLVLYLEHYEKRLEQIAIDPDSHKKELHSAIEFIFEKKLLFPKEIDYGVLLSGIEEATEESIDYDFFMEPDLPEEIKDVSDEDE